jgi:thymidine phosphorylase
VSYTAGITLHAKPGEAVREGGPLLTLHADSTDRFSRALESLEGAYEVGGALAAAPLIIDRIA